MPADTSMDQNGWLSRAWNLTLVTLIALLIWVVAESQTVQVAEFTPEVVFEPASEMQALRLAPGTEDEEAAYIAARRLRLTLRAQGPTAALDALRERLRGGIQLTAGDEFTARSGEQTAVQLEEALTQHEAFRGAAVTLIDVTPGTARLEVEDLTSLPARVVVEGAEAFEGSPEVSPAELALTVPASVARELEGTAVQVTVRPSAEDLASLEPGIQRTLAGLRAEPPADLATRFGVRVDQRPVSVTLTLRSRSASYTLPPLPVQVLLAPSELDRWVIEIPPGEQDLRDVVLTGPVEQIERVRAAVEGRSSEPVPIAALLLNFEELERGLESKQAEILRLPRGVVAEVEDRVVRFAVQPRVAETEPAGQPVTPAP